jgi:hypothetical protein
MLATFLRLLLLVLENGELLRLHGRPTMLPSIVITANYILLFSLVCQAVHGRGKSCMPTPDFDVLYLCLGFWPLVSETTQLSSLVNSKVTAVLQCVVCHPSQATLRICRDEGHCVTGHKKSTSCPYSRRRPIASWVESNVPINDHFAGSCFFVLVLGL